MLSPFLLYRAATFALFIVCNAVICTVAAWNLGFLQGDHLSTLAQIDSFLVFAGAFGLVVVFSAIFVEVLRKGAITSRVWFELAWIALFAVFNFAGAIAATAVAPGKLCSFKSDHSLRSGSACTSARVLIVFSWLNTGFLFIYFSLLTVFSIMHQKEDASVWHSTVRDFSWFETKQCIRSAPSSPVIARFIKSKSPSLVVPKPRHAPPPPLFLHGRAGLGSQVEIEHFTDIGSLEQQPISPPREAPIAPPPAALSFYPQHVQSTLHLSNTRTPVGTYQSNTYYSTDRGTSPPPIRDWPRPIASTVASSQPLSERAAQKQRALAGQQRSGSDASSTSRLQRAGQTRVPPPPPLPLDRTTTRESENSSSAQDSPTRSRPTGPRRRDGSSGFVRPRPPPLDLTRNGSTPNVRR